MMNKALMVLVISVVITGCAPVSHNVAQQDSSQNDLERLQGTWTQESEVIDGQRQPAEIVKTTITYAGHKWIVKNGNQTIMEGSSEFRPDKEPKEIDILPTSGPGAGTVLPGIYRLTGDTYESCFVLPGKERPRDFNNETNTGSFHDVFKREKL